MTNIAICISGQPRTWRSALPTWKNIFANADVFCHLWNFNTSSTATGLDDKVVLDKSEILDLLSFLKPKSFIIDNEIEHTQSTILSKKSHLSQFYGILAANNLKSDYEVKYNKIYDIVIKMRYDIALNKSLYMENVSVDKFNGFNLNIKKHIGTISDLFWIAPSEIHDKVSDIYLDISNIKKFNQEYYDNPEAVLFYQIRRNNIDVTVHNWNISIIRPSTHQLINAYDKH